MYVLYSSACFLTQPILQQNMKPPIYNINDQFYTPFSFPFLFPFLILTLPSPSILTRVWGITPGKTFEFTNVHVDEFQWITFYLGLLNLSFLFVILWSISVTSSCLQWGQAQATIVGETHSFARVLISLLYLYLANNFLATPLPFIL